MAGWHRQGQRPWRWFHRDRAVAKQRLTMPPISSSDEYGLPVTNALVVPARREAIGRGDRPEIRVVGQFEFSLVD